ncbi:hypothetical protein [Nocardia gamkensis]|uniref:Uncharacterized protein n=1 Tax=Nocardia gamkensis TaxID=352869 RepID=A0A7X6L1E5_9NOCA|nr:hypothetical protein [Nocardia gamkensis]NKY25864.1 hypothetical protein [Nocardia gamkensis]
MVTPTPEPEPDIRLDPGSYERGLAARRRAHELEADLDELFARLDRETDAALALSSRALEAATGDADER